MEEIKIDAKTKTEIDFNAFLDQHKPMQKTLNITEAGKILFSEIDNVEDKWNQYTNDDGTLKNVHSFIITTKEINYKCPTTVMDNIKEMRKTGIEKGLGKLIGFIVTKTGAGINTTYHVLPEFTK